ncbi:MAG: YceI family protein [Candidatus Zixiibacteriota bacterium]
MFKRPALVISAILVTALAAHGETFKIDPKHSHVDFTVRHLMISRVPGNFTGFSGTIEYDPQDTSKWAVDVQITTASINTGDSTRDKHLRSGDFLAVDSFPLITFKSTKVTPKGNGKFDVLGNLTMRGVTKPVTLNAEILGTMEDPRMGKRLGFAATTTIDRMDYGVSWNRTVEAGGLVVGHEVTIDLGVEAFIPKQ